MLTAFRREEDVLPLIQQNIGKKEIDLGGQLLSDFKKRYAGGIHNRIMIAIDG